MWSSSASARKHATPGAEFVAPRNNCDRRAWLENHPGIESPGVVEDNNPGYVAFFPTAEAEAIAPNRAQFAKSNLNSHTGG
jgi:hypothetical protein